MSVLFDSCILIDFLSGVLPARRLLDGTEGAAISRITWMEVMVGASTDEERQVLRGFLGAFDLLPIDGPVSEEAVTVRRERRMKLPDAIILATARVHGRTLVIRNTRDFAPDEPGVHVPYAL